MPLQSRTFDAGGLQLHALERPGKGPTAVLLHGWLDHAHGFDPLGACLPEDWRLLALDFRGHGQSGALPAGASHQFTDHVADLEALVRAQQLTSFHLVGHSLGGSVALAYAAARPELIERLTLIESLGPSGGDPERAPHRLRDFVGELFSPVRRRVYPSVEEAARRLHEANSSYSQPVALHMARFGTVAVEGGVSFRYDPGLKRTSGMTWDEQQVLATLREVRCPTQLIIGAHGLSVDDQQMRARLAALRDPAVHTLAGGHHVHLDDPPAVAAHVAGFC